MIWLLSRDRGLIKVKARGVRKIRAKLKGLLELFVLSDIELAKGRSLDIVTGGKQIESFDNLRGDLKLTSTAFYLSELLIEFLAENEQTDAYNLFLSALDNLNNQDDRLVIVRFLIEILSISGYSPELQSCLSCSGEIDKGNNNLDITQGGLICVNCQTEDSLEIDDNTVKLIRLIASGKEKIKVDNKYLIQAEKVLVKFIEAILEKKIKSRSFLMEVSNA
jgi:DNA repair protein RecO (recombination protein O)